MTIAGRSVAAALLAVVVGALGGALLSRHCRRSSTREPVPEPRFERAVQRHRPGDA